MDKHQRNIGATVSMTKSIHELVGHDDAETPADFTLLFVAESDSCDSKVDGMCTFHAEEDLLDGDTFTTPKCCVGNCPLGEIVDEELRKDGGIP